MSDRRDKRTFLGMPGYGTQTSEAGRALWRAARNMDHVHVAEPHGSLLAANFNQLWCDALNLVHRGKRVDYFAMIHSDIGTDDFWLDALIDELEAQQLDVLGVVVPIKDSRGLTSIALHQHGNNWRPAARLTMREVHRLPETFTSADVCHPLLLNTGLWVCRFDMAWARKVHFEINDRIVFNTALDCYAIENESEDWYFSRLCHELGLKLGATRKIRCRHRGDMNFLNDHPWGSEEFDQNSTAFSLVPDSDRDGFRFPRDIAGWLRRDEGRALFDLARGKRVLEVGSYCGRSTVCLAQSAVSVLSVDPHDGRATPQPQETFGKFQANIERYGVAGRVESFIGTLDEFPGGEFDLIFIDGAHDVESVRSDIEHSLSLLAPGGLLAFHDYRSPQDPGVAPAVDELIAAGGELLATHDTLAVVRPPAAIPLEV